MPPRRIVAVVADTTRELAGMRRVATEMDVPGFPLSSEVRAAGSILHDFYTAAERIFRHIAVQVDGDLPKGDDWHIQLLRRMVTDLPGLRPPVITLDLERDLHEYLRFRHLFRNVYGFELRWELLEPLARRLDAVEAELRSQLQSFLTFLNSLP